MGRHEQEDESLFEELDGPYLVGLGNWLAESLDVSELEAEQVLILEMVLERCLNALWQAFPQVILPLVIRAIQRLDSDDIDDDDE